MNGTRVADLTVAEFKALIREVVREALEDEKKTSPVKPRIRDQRGILDIPSLHVDPRHTALTIISREDMYGDDGR